MLPLEPAAEQIVGVGIPSCKASGRRPPQGCKLRHSQKGTPGKRSRQLSALQLLLVWLQARRTCQARW